jgi:hypothetical protein
MMKESETMSRRWWGKHWQKIAAAAIWIALIGSLVVFMRTNIVGTLSGRDGLGA